MSRIFQKFRQDVAAISWFSGALFLVLSLASFHPQDPSLNSIGSGTSAQNWCGLIGSFLSDGLYQLFGIASWMIAGAFARHGIRVFQGEKDHFLDLKTVWGFFIVVLTSSLLALYFKEVLFFQDQISIGGIVGHAVSFAAVKVLNPIGVQVLFWSFLLVVGIFYSEQSLEELSAKFSTVVRDIRKRMQTAKVSARLSQTSAQRKENSSSAVLSLQKFVLKRSKPESEESSSTKLSSAPSESNRQNSEPVQESLFRISEPDLKPRVPFKPKIQHKVENWELPKLSLLEEPPQTRIKIDEKEIKRKADLLKEKMAHFSVTGDVVAARPGPAVTLFEFKPDVDVKLSKITELADDLSLALSSESLRIIAPIPGRDVVGIETSNQNREVVYLKDLFLDESFWKADLKLPIPLGKQVDGVPKIVDLRKLPHLMVAGTTGSGKSVFVVSTLTSLLYRHSPQTLRLLLIDPKQVDLAAFEKIPHLILPLVTDSKDAVSALKWAVAEMEKRYRSMSEFGARGLESYNETVAPMNKEDLEKHEKLNQEFETTPGQRNLMYYFKPLPYLVIVIEEFGDLMTVDKSNVEQSVVRLAQKARACGIHLILAMQSPRKEVVTGLIKTNIPGRISFKVSSTMDSRIILDETGAERLLAQGDLLYRNPGGSNLIRHHAPYLKDHEVTKICQFWAEQGEPQYDDAAMKAVKALSSDDSTEIIFGDSDFDEKYDEILEWASNMKEISASLIQRRFQLGYPRAARIIETFEKQGVVGPAQGSKPRQVLIGPLPASQV